MKTGFDSPEDWHFSEQKHFNAWERELTEYESLYLRLGSLMLGDSNEVPPDDRL